MAPTGHLKMGSSTMDLSKESFLGFPNLVGASPRLEHPGATAGIPVTRQQPIKRVFTSDRSSELKSLHGSFLEVREQEPPQVPPQDKTFGASLESCIIPHTFQPRSDEASEFVSAVGLANGTGTMFSSGGLASVLKGLNHTNEMGDRAHQAVVSNGHCGSGAGLLSYTSEERQHLSCRKAEFAFGSNAKQAYASLLNAVRQAKAEQDAHCSVRVPGPTRDTRWDAWTSTSGSSQGVPFGTQERHPVSTPFLGQAALYDSVQNGSPGHSGGTTAPRPAVTSMSGVVQNVSPTPCLLGGHLERHATMDTSAAQTNLQKVAAPGKSFPIQATVEGQSPLCGTATLRTAETFSANPWKDIYSGLLCSPLFSVRVPHLPERPRLSGDAPGHSVSCRLPGSTSASHTLSSLKICSTAGHDGGGNASHLVSPPGEIGQDSLPTPFGGGFHARKLTGPNVEFLADPLGAGEKWGRRVYHTYPGTHVTGEGKRDSVVVKEIPLPACRVGDPVWEVEQHIHRMLHEWKDKQGARLIAIKGFETRGENAVSDT